MATPQGGTTQYNISKPKPSDESVSEETEDVSEGEDTEEASEDVEKGDDGEEGSTEEEEEQEEEEETPEQYLDVSKLPPQLREMGKRMLNTHTKNQAKLKKEFEESVVKVKEEFNEKYSEAVVKSAGWDKLVALPGFREFWEDVSNGRPYGYSSGVRKVAADDSEDDDSSASADGKIVSADALAKKLMPAIRKMIDDSIGPIREDRAKTIWADAEKNLPNFKKYKAEISNILTKHPTMSIQDAYDKASESDRINEAVQKALNDAIETGKKVPKKTLKPGSESGGKREVSKKTIDSIDRALSFARSDILGRA